MKKTDRVIDIFGTKYDLTFKDSVDCPNLRDGEVADGWCNSVNRYICVGTKQMNGENVPDYDVEKNMWHELIHAILNEGQYISLSDNEALVEWLARCIVSINKQF